MNNYAARFFSAAPSPGYKCAMNFSKLTAIRLNREGAFISSDRLRLFTTLFSAPLLSGILSPTRARVFSPDWARKIHERGRHPPVSDALYCIIHNTVESSARTIKRTRSAVVIWSVARLLNSDDSAAGRNCLFFLLRFLLVVRVLCLL